jgi:hypothetical protein
MDPDTTLKELLEAVQEGNRDRVQELAEALNDWIANGGYPPKTIGPWKLGQIWHVAMTKSVIKHAKAHVRVVARQKGAADVP